ITQTNHQTWRLAALGIIAGFAVSILALNQIGIMLSVVGMGIVALIADRKLSGLTGRSLAAIGALSETHNRIENTRRVLDQERTALQIAVDNMSQGLLLFDVSERLVGCNLRYLEIYRLSQEIVKPGRTLRQLIEHHRDSGSFAGDIDDYLHELRGRL